MRARGSITEAARGAAPWRRRALRWAWAAALVLAAPWSLAAAPDAGEIAAVRQKLQAAGLAQADVVQGADGRITLTGSYANRAEVLTAFSIAQQEVGVKWVAPTTPENIRYALDNARDRICAVLGTCKTATPAPAPPPRTASGGPRKHALVVGIGEFESPRVTPLKYAARDARLMYDYLVDPRGAAFPRANVTLLTDRAASRAAIESALDRIAAAAGPDDLVVLYISSHGTPPNDRGTMQILTHETQVEPRQNVFLTSLSDDRITDFASRIGRARLVAIIDTCYSGAAFEKVPGFLASGSKNLRLQEDRATVEGFSGRTLHTLATGSKDLRFEDEQHPLPPPSNQGPRILMSASSAGQLSWESDALQQSFFTHHLVRELRRSADLERAYLAAKPKVMTEVFQEKRADQTPQGVFMPRGTSFALR